MYSDSSAIPNISENYQIWLYPGCKWTNKNVIILGKVMTVFSYTFLLLFNKMDLKYKYSINITNCQNTKIYKAWVFCIEIQILSPQNYDFIVKTHVER